LAIFFFCAAASIPRVAGATSVPPSHCLESEQRIPVSTPHVLFVSVGIRGHAVPLLRVAKEFIRKNPNVKVSFATHHRAREWVKSTGANFLSLGRFPISSSELRLILKKISADPSMFRGLLTLFNEVYLPLFQPMYNGVFNIIVKQAPTLVVVDVAALGAIDAVQKFKIPLVLNSPTLPFSLDVSSHPWLPSWGTGYSIHMSLWERCMNILFPRLLAVSLTPAFIHLNKLRYGNTMKRYKSQHDVFYGKKILVNTAIGFDHPKPLSPWVEMVGLILPSDENKEATPLSNSLIEWLELEEVSPATSSTPAYNKQGSNSQPRSKKKHQSKGEGGKRNSRNDKGNEKNDYSRTDTDDALSEFTTPSSVIYINFGWMSRLEKKHIDALLNGLTDPRLRIVWTMSNDQRSLLPKNIPPSFKILNKLGQSTMHLLRRDEVKVVVSHCGIGVAQEALLFGKPLLCLPLFGDQVDVAARVLDRGVGRVLDKVRISSSDVRRAILEILRSYDTIAKEVKKVAIALKLAGGVNRAVTILQNYHEEHLVTETYSSNITDEMGVSSIVTNNQTYLRLVNFEPSQISWFERYYLDVYLLFLAIACFLAIITHTIIRLFFYMGVQFLHHIFKNNKPNQKNIQNTNNNNENDGESMGNGLAENNNNKCSDDVSGADGPD
jgi:UDP:flavonoid glycosyltransferase YjiC (YdhE family)